MIDLKSPKKTKNRPFTKNNKKKRKMRKFLYSNASERKMNPNTPIKQKVDPKFYRSDIKRNKNTLLHILESGSKKTTSQSNRFRELMKADPAAVGILDFGELLFDILFA